MTAILSLLLDGIILVLLGATIFYAIRLNKSLGEFRTSRVGMDRLLNDLTGQIDRAGQAIQNLRDGAKESGRELQSRINEANALSQELQILMESADNMAERLEQNAPRAPRRSGPAPAAAAPQIQPPAQSWEREPAPRRATPMPAPAGSAAFAIRDPEFDRDEMEEESDDDFFLTRNEESEDPAQFTSLAEKDLFDALRRRQKKTDAGGV
jgi:hypothetical protein